MDSQDQASGAVSAVIKVMRRLTRVIQVIPFAYLLFYAAYMLLGSFASDGVMCVADSVMLVSPVATGGMMAASKLLKLCRWHKIAVLIPTTSQIEGYIDSFVITFTQEEVFFINLSLGILAASFFILACRHFIHGR